MRVTARGWGLLIAGALLALASAALQSLTTARIAALVLAVPLVCLLWAIVARLRSHRRGLRREIAPATWQVGIPARVTLTPTGPRLPPWSTLRERVPTSLRRRSLGASGYSVLPSERGRHRLGPAILQRADPLAVTSWRQPLGDATDVLVWPRTELVDDDVLAHALEASSPRSLGLPQRTPEDLTVREYRRGDDLHRVHWRSSARHGELMVRHDEPTTTRVMDLLLVLGGQRDEASEWAVSAAASMGLALLRNDYDVRVVTVSDGELTDSVLRSDADVLDVFALADTSSQHALEAARAVARSTSAGVVAVLDRPEDDLVGVLAAGASLQQSTALVIDPDDAAPGLLDQLARGGWLVGGSPGTGDLAQAWRATQAWEPR